MTNCALRHKIKTTCYQDDPDYIEGEIIGKMKPHRGEPRIRVRIRSNYYFSILVNIKMFHNLYIGRKIGIYERGSIK